MNSNDKGKITNTKKDNKKHPQYSSFFASPFIEEAKKSKNKDNTNKSTKE